MAGVLPTTRRRDVARYAHAALFVYIAAICGLIVLVVYKILTDTTVPLFTN